MKSPFPPMRDRAVAWSRSPVVVMTSSDAGKTCGQLFFDYYWGSGFLPSRFQGVRFRNTGDLVPYLRAVKQVFDPNGILNPGKVVREEAGAVLRPEGNLGERQLGDVPDNDTVRRQAP